MFLNVVKCINGGRTVKGINMKVWTFAIAVLLLSQKWQITG